jgi:hypothetical protein
MYDLYIVQDEIRPFHSTYLRSLVCMYVRMYVCVYEAYDSYCFTCAGVLWSTDGTWKHVCIHVCVYVGTYIVHCERMETCLHVCI